MLITIFYFLALIVNRCQRKKSASGVATMSKLFNFVSSILLPTILLVFLFIPAQAAVHPLQEIESDGVIQIGVKTDYKPFGFLNEQGDIVGFGPDLARHIANSLDVKLDLVPVQSSNRIMFLRKGRIDLILATMLVTETRAKQVSYVKPYYNAGGGTILVSDEKAKNIKSWNDVEGMTLCGTQGSLFNKTVAMKYGADVKAFPSTTQVQSAVLNGVCAGILQDNILLALMKENSSDWNDYSMPLPVLKFYPWGMAIKKPYKDTALWDKLSDVIKHLYADGTIVDLNEKWGLPKSSYMLKRQEKYRTEFSK